MNNSFQTDKFDREEWLIREAAYHCTYLPRIRYLEISLSYQSKLRPTNIFPGSINFIDKTSHSLATIQEISTLIGKSDESEMVSQIRTICVN